MIPPTGEPISAVQRGLIGKHPGQQAAIIPVPCRKAIIASKRDGIANHPLFSAMITSRNVMPPNHLGPSLFTTAEIGSLLTF